MLRTISFYNRIRTARNYNINNGYPKVKNNNNTDFLCDVSNSTYYISRFPINKIDIDNTVTYDSCTTALLTGLFLSPLFPFNLLCLWIPDSKVIKLYNSSNELIYIDRCITYDEDTVKKLHKRIDEVKKQYM